MKTMEHFASNIKIQNFKSIKELDLNDCKRINLFIGRPNVGKSNILEALSLFSLPYYTETQFNKFIRIENNSELFFDGDQNSKILIEIDNKVVIIDDNNDTTSVYFGDQVDNYQYSTSGSLNYISKEADSEISPISTECYPYKSYIFPKKIEFNQAIEDYLSPPNGENLFDVIQQNKPLKEEFIKIFQTYGLHLVFDKSSQELKVMKGVEKGEIFLIPFSSIADSLQRLIFYKTAIKSNKNSVITFEEPEAHTYPPYIAQIAEDITEAKSNQFFITTHSPYVVNEFLENAQQELCIFLVDFKNGETVAKRLTDEELETVYNDGIDLFFNNEYFT